MRKNFEFKFLVGATLGAALLVFFNVTVLGRVRPAYAPAVTARASLFNAAGSFHEFIGYLRQWRKLSAENKDLQTQLNQNLVRSAQLESLQRENDTLRRAGGLSNKLNKSVMPAGLFGISLTPEGYSALVNKGSEANVATGDIVLTLEGYLVGRVQYVFAKTSRITLVSDPTFRTTVRVLAGETSGIAKGALKDGLVLELVVQTDQVSEGDVLVSTGDDDLPAGLVVGTITNVKSNETEIFKQVKITPAMNFAYGRVVIIKP